MSEAPTDPPARGESPRLFRGSLAALAVLGAVIGLATGLQATRTFAVGGVDVSVGAVAALVLNAALGVLGAWGLRSRDAALAPGIGWFVMVLALLFLPRPGGDIVLPGSGAEALSFLLLGIVGAIAAAFAATRLVPARPAGPARPARPAGPDGSGPQASPQGRRRR